MKLHEKIIVFGIITVLLGIVAVGFIPFSVDTVNSRITQAVIRGGADSCTIGKTTIVPWLGVWCTDMRLVVKTRYNATNIVVLPTTKISIRFFSLAWKWLTAPEKLFMPDATQERSGPFLQQGARTISRFPLTPYITGLSVARGTLTGTKNKHELYTVSGISAQVRIQPDSLLFVRMSVAAQKVQLFEKIELADFRAELNASDTLLSIDNIRGKLYGGKVRGDCRINIARMRCESSLIQLSGVDLATYYAQCACGGGTLEGRTWLELKVSSCALAFDSLKGTGKLRLTDVAAKDLPVQKNLAVLLIVPDLANISFKKITADFEMDGPMLYMSTIKGEGRILDFGSSGWIWLDGNFSQHVTGMFSKEYTARLPDLVRNSLAPEPGGSSSFAFTIKGPFNNPRIELDKKIMKRAVNAILDDLKTGLQDFFK